MKILILDNYDSFTYNLVQYFGELKADIKVIRNDDLNVSQITALKPKKIVISPGPGRPENAGVSVEIIKQFKTKSSAKNQGLDKEVVIRTIGVEGIKEVRANKQVLTY